MQTNDQMKASGEPADRAAERGSEALLAAKDDLLRAQAQMLQDRECILETRQRAIKELKGRVRAQERQIARMQQHMGELEERQIFYDRELRRTQEDLRETWNSRSWRLMAPFRFGTRMLKKVYHKVRSLGGCVRHGSVRGDKPARMVRWMPKVRRAFVPAGSSALTMAHPKRLAILFFFDGEGVVDDYVVTLLSGLRAVADKVLVVASGELTEASREKLRNGSDEVLQRKNVGFDSWSYKAALEHVGWAALADYDEVLLTNHTIMGPVYPFAEMFAKMAARDVEFWGLSAHCGLAEDPFHCCPYGCVPEHIQSYWLVFRKPMVQSPIFRAFWDKLPMIHNYDEAVGLFEAVLTRYFAEAGFRWDTFLDRKAYYDLTDNPMVTLPVEMLRDQRCPVFKRRAFFQDYDYLLSFTGTQCAPQLVEYLEQETDYDMDLLWDNLLRTCHMSDLRDVLHLVRVLPAGVSEESREPSRAALFMHLYDTTMTDMLTHYASSLPADADIYISTTSAEKKKRIAAAFAALPNRVEIRVCPNRGRDVSGLLACFKDVVMRYEFICVTHDKRTAYLKPQTVGEGFAYSGYENILGSADYVANVLATFRKEPRLGLMTSPAPNHADFATQVGLEWGQNCRCTQELAKDLGLHVPMDEKHPPCAPFGSNFWARTEAMKPLFAKNWTYEDFPAEPCNATDGTLLHAIERIYPFVAQDAGYYTVTAMTDDFSAIEIGNLQFYADSYTHLLFDKGIRNRYISLRAQLDEAL